MTPLPAPSGILGAVGIVEIDKGLGDDVQIVYSVTSLDGAEYGELTSAVDPLVADKCAVTLAKAYK